MSDYRAYAVPKALCLGAQDGLCRNLHKAMASRYREVHIQAGFQFGVMVGSWAIRVTTFEGV